MNKYPLRHDWSLNEILEYFNLAFLDLIFQAQTVHRQYFDPNQIQLSSLLNIKTGNCSEDCAYCPQSVHFNTTVEADDLLPLAVVQQAAKAAKANGASRFCMGAAWRKPHKRHFAQVLDMVSAVKNLGLETCMTLGMLEPQQVIALKQVGLDYYNHNVDTSAEFYPQIVTTHSYQDRLDTIALVQEAEIKVCAGGIVGLGESQSDRAAMLQTLANLPKHPDSVPINRLIPIAGTPLAAAVPIDDFDLVRCLAVARIIMPASMLRLSAGRTEMSDALQVLCFLAGANSIFYGDKLLTTANPSINSDQQLLNRLGLNV